MKYLKPSQFILAGLLICCLSLPAQAAWMYALCRMEGGFPKIDTQATPVHGWVYSGQIGQWGAYLFSGTGAQLQALNALPEVVGIVGLTIKDVTDPETGVVTQNVRWIELEDQINATVRTKINTWLAANNKPLIPADWTNRQVVRAIWRYARANWDWNQDWVKDE